MNEFRDQLGALARNVGKEYELTAVDNSAALVRRAKRGRVVWTGAVGTATLASAAVIAIGGNAAANSLFDGAIAPATHSPSADDNGIDDSATHDVNDDNGIDDSATHDVNDDNGIDDPATHDVNDDNGNDDSATHDANDDNGEDDRLGHARRQ